MNKRRIVQRVSFFLVLSGIILSLLSVFSSFYTGFLRNEVYRNNNISREEFSVSMDDGANIRGIKYANTELETYTNQSVSSILMINGINQRKEANIDKVFQLAMRGYAVFTVELRGHGLSNGPTGFLAKEPNDMIQVLDYIESNYNFVNTTQIGLLAFSFGGGVGAIFQALDERIYCTVLYHPLSSIERLTERLPFENLIGITINIPYLGYVEDAYDIASTNNTQNLLIIQGLSDQLIFPEDNIIFYNSLDGPNRDDIQLELRPDLGHSANEADDISFKHTLVWFKHFFIDNNVNITNRAAEISSMTLYSFKYPSNPFSNSFLMIGVICIFSGMTIIALKQLILPKWKSLPLDLKKKSNNDFQTRRYKKMVIYRTIVYFFPILILAPTFGFLSKSFVYTYFGVYPLITSILLLFFPSELHQNFIKEWKKKIKNGYYQFFITLFIILIPLLIYVGLYNINASLSLNPQLPFLNTSIFSYLLVLFGSVVMDFLYLREMKNPETFLTIITRPITLLYTAFFIPISPFPYLGGIFVHLLFFILTGIVIYYIRQVIIYLSKIFKTTSVLFVLILLPIYVYVIDIFLRLL